MTKEAAFNWGEVKSNRTDLGLGVLFVFPLSWITVGQYLYIFYTLRTRLEISDPQRWHAQLPTFAVWKATRIHVGPWDEAVFLLMPFAEGCGTYVHTVDGRNPAPPQKLWATTGGSFESFLGGAGCC